MAETELGIVIKAVDEASKQLQTVTGELKKMGEEGEKGSSILSKVGTGLKVLGAAAVGAGTAIAGFALKSVSQFASVGDEINKMSIRTGISTEALSRLRYAAEMSNVPLESLEGAMKRMSVAVTEAEAGNKKMVETLAMIGLKAEDLKDLSIDQVFLNIGKNIAAIEDPMKKAAVATEFFGKTGTNLLPLLQSDIKKLGDEAQKLGLVFSKDMAEKAEAFKDAQTRIKGQLEGLMFAIGGQVMPILSDYLDKIFNLINATKEWYEAIGGFEGIKNKAIAWINELLITIDTNTGLITALKDAWNDIKIVWDENVKPALDRLWETLKPHLPFLRELAKVVGVILLGALHLLVQTIKISVIVVLTALEKIIKGVTKVVEWCAKAWDTFTSALANVINWGEKLIKVLKDVWDWIVKVYEKISGGVGKAIGAVSGAFGAIGGAIGFQEGGIVTSPTLAVVGEAGAEAVIPLNRLGEFKSGNNITININGGYYLSEDAALDIGDKIVSVLKQNLRIS